jgi:hypothetical protein
MDGSMPEGSHTVTITAADKAGRIDTEVYNFTYDKTPPTAAFNAPSAGIKRGEGGFGGNTGRWLFYDSGVYINGQTDIKGLAFDNTAIAKISYRLGRLNNDNGGGDVGSVYENDDGWTDTSLGSGTASAWSGTVYSWTYTHNFDVYEGQTDKIIEDTGSNDMERDFYLPLYIKVEDAAGNALVLHYNVWVDPDQDKPVVTIATPADNTLVGGPVRVSGTAQDDDWIYGVQIRITNTGKKPGESGYYYKDEADDFIVSADDGWVWAKIVGNTDVITSWYYNLNARGELDPQAADAQANRVLVEVRAADAKDAAHEISDVIGRTKSISVDFDAKVPVISNVKIARQDGRLLDYTAGVRAGGTFTFSAELRDDGDISGIRVRETGDPAASGFTDLKTGSKSGWTVTPLGNIDGFASYRIERVLDSTEIYEYGKTGIYNLELQVTDNTDPVPYMAVASYSVMVDNYYPTLKFTTQFSASTANFYISGTADDYKPSAGSVEGLERVLVYFERNNGYMNAAGEDKPGRIAYAQWKDRSADDDDGNEAPESNGTDRFPLLTLDNGVWKSEHAMVIDSSEGSEDLDHDGTYGERWNPAGTVREWMARFDTTIAAIPDGPITVHYVAIDLAGNASHYTQKIFIRNNPPIIRRFTLGTDLDGDGNIGGWEKSAPKIVAAMNDHGTLEESDDTFISINEGMDKAIETGFTARNYKLDFELNTFGGNNAKHYQVTHVKPGAELVPAAALEPGKVYSIFKEGSTSWDQLGAPNNNEGTVFVATSKGSGTGKALPYIPFEGTRVTASPAGDTGTVSYAGAGAFTNIGDSITGNSAELQKNKLFIIKVYDTTTPGGEEEQLAHAILINMDIDNVDDALPVTGIDPFYWNGVSENSLYENKKANGHIELEADLPAGKFNEEDGIMDGDPKVSGQISIRGTARDNTMLKSLWIYLDGFPFAGGETETINGKPYVKAAEYLGGGGNWNGAGQWETGGWRFTVNAGPHDQTGHRVSWRLDIDTARITNAAAADRVFRIIARDGQPDTPNTAAEDNTPTGADRTNYYRLDVVPYISGISTPARNQGGLKDNNIRAADGKYSVIQGTNTSTGNSTFITVSGFNLKPLTGGVTLLNREELAAYRPDAVSGRKIEFSGAAAPWTKISLTNISDHSGYLTVYGGTAAEPVGSLNNINNNEARGTYPLVDSDNGLDQENMPNREGDRYITKNITLTDDRYLQFFAVKDTKVKNGYYPVMEMNGNNPVFGYVDLTGGPEKDPKLGPDGENGGAGNYFGSNAMPQRAEFNAADGSALYTEYLIKASIWDQMGMAKDAGGRYIHASTYNRDGGSFHLIYDRYAELHSGTTTNGTFKTGMGWGAGTKYSDLLPGFQAQYANNNAIALETVNYRDLQLDRYLYPKLIARGNSRTGYAAVYALYFDDRTGELAFRNFQIGAYQAGNRTYPLYSGGTASDNYAYGQYTNFPENRVVDKDYPNIYNVSHSYATGRLTAASVASKYFDMAVSSKNTVVFAYYDETDGRLKLRYSKTPVTGANPTAAISWSDSPVALPDYVGMYVSLVMDGNDGLHIAAFDAVDSDLKYIYIPDYAAAAYTAVTVDQYGAVGNWTQIKLNKAGVPYIAYYNATETGGRDSIKLAWAGKAVASAEDIKPGVDSNGYTTGDWKYMTVPALTPPQGGSPKFQKVNLGFRTDNKPVLGYLGTNIEFSYPVDE